MHPILFEIGPFRLYSYGLMFALALLGATYLAGRIGGKFDVSPAFITDLSFRIIVSGIIGARIFYAALNYREFMDNPLEAFMFWRGGLVFYGGFICALFFGIRFIRKNKLSAYRVIDCIAPYAALGHSIGRIGCLLNGCCYGRPTTGWFGITADVSAARVHPTQIYSSLGLLLIFLILRIIQERPHKEGDILLIYAMLYGSFRFIVEFLRGDTTAVFLSLSISQVLSLVLVSVAFILYAKRRNAERI